MSKTAMIRARIEPELKEEVESVLKKLGLTVTEAFDLFLHQVRDRGRLPFEENPNRGTLRTIRKTDARQELTHHESLEDLRKHLGF